MEIQIFMSGKNMSLNISKDSLVSQMPRNSKEKKMTHYLEFITKVIWL